MGREVKKRRGGGGGGERVVERAVIQEAEIGEAAVQDVGEGGSRTCG